MNAIINKAEKKAISALMKEIKRREGYRSLENPRAKRLLKQWFIKEFWRRILELQSRRQPGILVPDPLDENCPQAFKDAVFELLQKDGMDKLT